MKNTASLSIIVVLIIFLFSCAEQSETTRLPNVVFIMADDMGYGDVSAYNENTKIKIPFIDQLAEEGVMFTDAHTSSSVCTPARYGIICKFR